MKEVNINLQSAAFPNQFVSDSQKKTMEYGLQIGQAIQYEWFRKDSGGSRFHTQWGEFNRLRLYARGEQSVAKYKNELAIDGDLSYLNLDWTPVPIIPKFVDIVVNGLNDRLFKVRAYAEDAMSAEKRNQFQEIIEGDMIAKTLFTQIEKDFDVNVFTANPEELPENEEEMQLYMQMKYKPAIEIAEEEAINTLLAENHYDDIRKRVDYDITTLGVGITKHQFLPGAGVEIDYVDPANVVYSYTEDPYFKDVFYWGEVKTIPMTELVKINPDITPEEMEEISKYSQAWYDYFNSAEMYQNSMFSRNTCTLLYFNYKSTNKFVYKKKTTPDGNFKVVEKDDSFNPPPEMMEEGDFEKIEKTIEVWYDGIMVMGTNIMLKWDLAENMVRPNSASQMAYPNYVACAPRSYKGNYESLVRRMIPFADLIQMTHLKIQQVVSQTGSVVGRSYTQDGEYNNARVPIQQLTSSSGAGKLQMLIANYNHYMDMIRTVTGLNEARDGSTPDPNSLVGVQKLAALNSNTATRHILNSSLYITRTLAEALSIRTADVLEYAEFRDEFAMQIGKYNVGILEDIKNLYLHDFGIFIDMSPDEEQRAMLEQNIQMALSKQDINLEDALDIRELNNLKMANQLLKVKRKRKKEDEMQQQMQQQQMQAQMQMQAQQATVQAEQQKIQLETQSKMQLKQAEVAFDIERMTSEAELKKQLMGTEFQYAMSLKGIEQSQLDGREQQREKAKSQRISQANTEQSKLIEQRQRNLPPVSFESNEDTLDGFDFSEFNPR